MVFLCNRFFARNFKLLSFGAEAEEDEEAYVKVNEQFAGRSKSTHDVLGRYVVIVNLIFGFYITFEHFNLLGTSRQQWNNERL